MGFGDTDQMPEGNGSPVTSALSRRSDDFISSPLYVHKPYFFVHIMADCTVPFAPGQAWGDIVQEFIHAGRLNERPPHMTILTGAPDGFPEYPGFEDFPIR